MTDINRIDKGCDDGNVLGQTTSSKIGFYGITPTVQQSALTTELDAVTYTTASAYATTITQIAASSFGFVDTAEAQTFLMVVQNIQKRIGDIESRLSTSGLIAGGTAITDASLGVYDIVGFGTDDGSYFGQDSSEKISFWGTAPVVQMTALTTCATTIALTALTCTADYTIATLVTGATAFGFATLEDAASVLHRLSNLQTKIGEVEDRLAQIGVITGGTALTSTTKYDYLDKGNDDGTIMGRSSSVKLGFWGTTPCDQPSALTTAETTITITSISSTTTDYAIADLLATAATWRFTTATAGYVTLLCIQNAQIRMAEIEARLEELGLVAAN